MKTTIRLSGIPAGLEPAPALVATPAAPALAIAPAAFANREAWLQAGIGHLDQVFAAAGVTLPAVHASVGFGYGSRGSKSAVIGQCWDRKASADGKAHVFVSPTISDGEQALSTLAHELIHAAIGTDEGHGPRFKSVARAIGLVGPMRATVAGDNFTDQARAIIEKIGAYPHAAISMADREAAGISKQGTRMLKFVCSATGYTVRTTQKWVDLYGAPISPASKVAMVAA